MFNSDIDDCVNATCQNLGTCNDGVNDYNCSCVTGYTGQHCETSKSWNFFSVCHFRVFVLVIVQ